MRKIIFMATLALLTAACQNNKDLDKTPITKPQITIEGGRLTPEALWAMGRINSVHPDEQSGRIAYTISYYSVEENRSTSWIRVCQHTQSPIANSQSPNTLITNSLTLHSTGTAGVYIVDVTLRDGSNEQAQVIVQ